jgi:prolyl-tRNA editing enzyme YbaK/EbsC (Cys-tRNA(Pro) deacylase)
MRLTQVFQYQQLANALGIRQSIKRPDANPMQGKRIKRATGYSHGGIEQPQ